MTDIIQTLHDHTNVRAESLIDVPAWVEDDITAGDIASILEGGCASGAYMPAVTYHKATATMADHGDDVLQYIQDSYGELPQPESDESWSGIAVHYLSFAVELWAQVAAEELSEAIEEADEDTLDDPTAVEL